MGKVKGMSTVAWDEGVWLNPPHAIEYVGTQMLVTAAKESDFWRNTSYGFVHESAHALLVNFPDKSSIEVSFILDFNGSFDQAGLILYSDMEHWTKAGFEFSDGVIQLGAVVTDVNSDWSVAPIHEWFGREVSVRASRDGNAVTIRAKVAGEDEPWRLVRLLPIDPNLNWQAGPHFAAPVREGLVVRFTCFDTGEADSTLH